MIMTDASRIKNLFGKQPMKRETYEEISKWVGENPNLNNLNHSHSLKSQYPNIRSFDLQMPRNTSIFLTH